MFYLPWIEWLVLGYGDGKGEAIVDWDACSVDCSGGSCWDDTRAG